MDSLHPAMDQFERPDPVLTNKIVTQLKSQGIFDQFRRECMADVDTKPAYQNLRQRVEGSVAAFLKKNPWRPDMNKNQLRDNLRKHIQSGGFLDIGVDRIVDQVVNPKIYTVFLPKVEEVVHNCLSLDKDKPKTDLSPYANAKPEIPKFKNKHNLAPRARLPAPLTAPRVPIIPNIEALKPPEPVKNANNDKEQVKASDSPEEPVDDKYVVDEYDAEVVEEEEDEESPPFEPVSESDQMILGVHTDSSDENSDESRIGVVTGSGGEDSDDSDMKQATTEKVESEERVKTESEKERSDNDEKDRSENEEKEMSDIEEREKSDISGGELNNKSEHEKETSESDEKEDIKKDLDYSSDEYVPKTPTINMESSDGTVIEFNSISEYKQYQSKYNEDSLGNVEEEVVSSQWVDESSNAAKEYRSSNEEDSGGGLQKRKLMDHFDDASSSSVDKGSTSDEGKSYSSFVKKKIKIEEEPDSEATNNEDSNTEKSYDMDHKLKSNLDHKRRHTSSTSSKDSGRSHHRHEGHIESSRHHSSLSSSREKEPREGSVSSSHSSRDKRDGKKDSKHDSSKDRHRDPRKSDPSASKTHESSRSKYSEKEGKDEEKKRTEKTEDVKKDIEEVEVKKYKSESRHELRDKPKSHQDKERKKHENQDKQSPGKRDHDSSYKQDRDKRDDSRSSKHSHSSSRHRSSAEKYKSDKEKHKEYTSDKSKHHDKKFDKDSKKRHREHCKTSDIDNEGRRSTDRDSNGPGGRSYSHSSSTSRSTSSRSRAADKTLYTGDRSSNSDNTVSDKVDAPREDPFYQGIASPDPEPMEDTWGELYLAQSEVNEPRAGASGDYNLSKGEIDKTTQLNEVEECSKNCKTVGNSVPQMNSYTSDIELPTSCKSKELRIEIEKISDNHEAMKYVSNTSSESYDENDQDPTSSVHDTSSEKENIEQVVNFSDKNNTNETLQVDEKLPKFKKPKIAANIFEVRKIMQARRRMEKKRMKLLMKSNTEECATSESTPSITGPKETPPEEFMGFDDFMSNKIKTYDCLIQKLNSEVSTFAANLGDNPNLITSWIEVNPELDDYIENVLNGKVHRKMRVRLPKISDEHYKFDTNEDAYILIQNTSEDSGMMENNQLVDNNLNNLNPSLTNQEKKILESTEINQLSILNKFNGSTSKSTIQGSNVEETKKNNNSPKRKSLKQSSESPVLENKREKLHSEIDQSNSVSDANDSNGKLVFSLTFNQTYDEILKEKTPTNSVDASKMLKAEVYKNPRTVVKITNDKTTEQLIVKPVQGRVQDKVVQITKSEPVLNGKVSNDSQGKSVPLISRINKSRNVVVTPVSAAKTAKVNGIVSPDSTMFEAAVIDNISEMVINSVIGIQSPSKCGEAAVNQGSPTRENLAQKIQRETRGTGLRQQHYDNSDLYKPRLQLSSRRVRGQLSPDDCKLPTVLTGRKRPMVVTAEVTTPKRRR